MLKPTRSKYVALFESEVGDDRSAWRTDQPIIEVKVSKLSRNITRFSLMKMAFFLQMNKRASNGARALI
jgi:hypothetical protein